MFLARLLTSNPVKNICLQTLRIFICTFKIYNASKAYLDSILHLYVAIK